MRNLFAGLVLATALMGTWVGPTRGEETPLLVPVPDSLSWGDVLDLKAMHYAVIPRGKSNILFAWGPVEEEASVRFRQALDAAKPISEIWLYSQGGILDEGLEIGRMIHARKLATHILRGQRCVSACNFMFMGGVVRYVDSGAQFEVHMFSDNQANHLRQDLQAPPKTYEALLKKFSSMDVDVLINALTSYYPDLEVTPDSFQAAVGVVKQQNSVDASDDDALSLAAVKKIIADYNHDHADHPIDEGAAITRIVLDEDVKRVQMDSAKTAAVIARFLTEMGLSLKFLTRFAEIHNDQPTALTREELREFNVMNTD